MPPRNRLQTVPVQRDSIKIASGKIRKVAIGLCRVILLAGLLSIATFIAFASETLVTNSSANAIHARSSHGFVLFRNLRWYPMRPQSEAWIDNLTLAGFVAVPCVAALLLKIFFRKRKEARSSGWVRLVVGNGLVVLFLFSILLLAAETRFRFLMDTTDSLGFTKISERWVARHWHVNGAGCRDNIEYAAALQPGRRRVSFVGDSFTAGHGINDVNARFANRLRALHPDWEVHLLAN